MKETTLLELITQAKTKMVSLGLSEGSLRNYEYNGFRPIQDFFINENEEKFSVPLVGQCMLQAKKEYECGGITHEKFRAMRKIGMMLEEFNKKGSIMWNRIPPEQAGGQLCQYFADILSEYICEKKGIYSHNTINYYKSIVSQYLGFLEQKGHQDFHYIPVGEASKFIPYIAVRCPASMKGVITALRSFFAFLADRQLTNIDPLPILQGMPAKRRKVFPGFSHDEAKAILGAVDRNTATGKRDYAMLLLLKNTGLRSIDIINLQRSNIDWWNNEIHIVQHKTRYPLVLPLDYEVGSAIADYILYGRPGSETPYIFLRSLGPLKKLADHGPLYAILSKHMKAAGISHGVGERKGPHSFRRSIGTWMLEAGVPLSTISEILGHASPDSSKPYISTDLERLRACALSLDGIAVAREGLL